MCSFAAGAGPRVTGSAAGCARVRVVTLEKKLIFCSCPTSFVFRSFSLQALGPGVTQGWRLSVLFEDAGLNPDTSDARARTSFAILLERLVIEMGTPVLRL